MKKNMRKIQIAKKMHKNNKKCLSKIEKFCQKIRQGPYFICTVCHWYQRLYKHSVRLFEHEKYHIPTAELYCPVRSFDEKTYTGDTYHKHLSRNEMPCQVVFNKMSLDPIPDELKDFKKLEKILIFKRIILKKIAIIHGKGEFAKINILPSPADSNGLIVVKLKRALKCRGYVYFEEVRPNFIHQALNYLKTHNKFYEDISISETSLKQRNDKFFR